MSNEQEFIPQISKGYTCKLCGIEVPEGEFHDCELDEPLKWGQIASDNQKTTPSDWLERISSLSKLCDEKSNRIKELELRITELEAELLTINELYGGGVLPSLGHRIDEIMSKSQFKKFL